MTSAVQAVSASGPILRPLVMPPSLCGWAVEPVQKGLSVFGESYLHLVSVTIEIVYYKMKGLLVRYVSTWFAVLKSI